MLRDPYPWQDPEFWKPANLVSLVIDLIAFAIAVSVLAAVIAMIGASHILT